VPLSPDLICAVVAYAVLRSHGNVSPKASVTAHTYLHTVGITDERGLVRHVLSYLPAGPFNDALRCLAKASSLTVNFLACWRVAVTGFVANGTTNARLAWTAECGRKSW
jgi:hypothetical protein